MKKDLSKYKYIIAYGIGQNYHYLKNCFKEIKFDFVMDEKWENNSTYQQYEGIKIISFSNLNKISDALIVVMPTSESIYFQVKSKLKSQGVELDVCHISELVEIAYELTGSMLRKLLPNTTYSDEHGNSIKFDDTISEGVKIKFYGVNNNIVIGHNVSIGELKLFCGNNVKISIGDNTSIIGAQIHASEARVTIGCDCMISDNIIIRNHDDHHIFNLNTLERINYSKDIVIGNQVWLGRGVVLHGGCCMGDGCIVGENAVTSAVFPDHVIVAGVPAKIIRRGVCWSRDNSFLFNRHNLKECLDQAAKKYF